MAAFLDSVVPAAMRAEGIPGAVVSVVSGGRIILSRGYGLADIDTRRAMTDTTIVRIGSISKLMTAVAVAQLADRGRITLDADVNQYLRGVRVPTTYRTPVTARHLLTHTSALDEIRPGTQAETRAGAQSLPDFLRKRLVRYADPGVATAYSTYGMTLAGLLVEDVSGMSFERYLQQNVWQPLGMTRTSIDIAESQQPLVAVPYDVENGKPVRARWEWYHTTPASSVNSSASDMAKFMLAQLAGASGIMSERMTREMQREQVTMHPLLPGLGLGWQQLVRPNGDRGVQHGGDVAGFSALLTLLPSRNTGIFVASHREGGDLRFTVTTALLERMLPGRAAVVAPVTMHPSPSIAARRAARYAGHYRANTVCHTCASPVQVPETDLVANADGTLSAFGARWVEVSERFFRSQDGARRFGFREDSLGRVTHLTMGAWQVMERVPMRGTASDSAAIRTAAIDYVDGWYEGDAARMERAVHPDLAKRIWSPDPQRGANRLENQTAMTLVLGTRRGGGRTTPDSVRRREVEKLEIFGNAASARVRMTNWVDLMHLARTGNQWKIVNVLWELSAAEAGDTIGGGTAIRTDAGVSAAVGEPDPALRRKIQAVNDSMAAAFNAGDLLGVSHFYTDDARVDGKGGVLVQGREALDKYWMGIRNPKSWKLEVLEVGGHLDHPYQIGRSTLVTSSPTGDRTSVVEFLAIWRRSPAGGLRLAVDYYR